MLIKEGHIPHKAPFGYKRVDKILVPDEATKDDIIRIFNLYHEGNSYQTISNLYNKEQVLGKTNWKDSTILKIIENEVYKGDFVHGKRTNNPTYYENVVEPLISKKLWDKFIKFLQDKFFFTNKYDDIIDELYEEEILDNDDMDTIRNEYSKDDDLER